MYTGLSDDVFLGGHDFVVCLYLCVIMNMLDTKWCKCKAVKLKYIEDWNVIGMII